MPTPSTQEVVKRVIPSFNGQVAQYLAIAQAGVGVVTLILAAVALGIKVFVSVGGSGIIASIALIACGIVGFFASRRKIMWLILLFLAVSVISIAMCLTLVGASGVGIQREPHNKHNSAVPLPNRQAVNVLCLITGMVGACLSGITAALCCLATFYGCCKPATGAKYVTNSQVSYNKNSEPSSSNQAA